MRISKNQIEKTTTSRKIAMSNQCNYTYQIETNENYTKDTDENVLYNVGNHSERIGYSSTKKEFVELVYSHINNK